MIRVTRTFPVPAAAASVISYLTDFSHAEDWDPGTDSCEREDSGPVRVGSTWHNVSRFLGRRTELTYELTALEADHLIFTGTNGGATSTDDIRVTALSAHASEVTYRASIQLRGPARLATPAAKLAMERVADRTVRQMQAVIASL